MMRVLLIHNHYQLPGGEDAVFDQEVSILRENGYAVETIEFSNEGFDGTLSGNLSGAIRSVYNSKSARRVEQAIDSFRPDVVHIHNLFYTASPSVIRAAKRRGIPVVMTLHNYRLVCAGGTLSRVKEMPCERCLTKLIPIDGVLHGCFRNSHLQSLQLTALTSLHKLTGLWRSVDRFIVLTEFAREKILLSSLRLSPEQVVVKPNSLSGQGFVGAALRQDFFLFIGRLSNEKGIQTLIQAAYLHQFPLEIIGDGPMRPLVEQAAQELSHVRYHGPLPRQQVMDRMKQSRAIVVPSICYEGLPTVILEAFSTGTPILCSNGGNLNSIVTDKQTGLLFKPASAESLVSAIRAVTDELCIRFAEAGYAIFHTTYRTPIVLEKLNLIYSSIIRKSESVVS